MKIFKFEYTYTCVDGSKEISVVRLPFVKNGEWQGFTKDNKNNYMATVKFFIDQGEKGYNFKGLHWFKENDLFSWPDDKGRLGTFKYKLIKTDANNEDVFVLPNGVEMPRLSFGTWLIEDEDARTIVKKAINAGYLHIDTAQAYRNEVGVGEAIKNSIFPREDIFITSKVEAEIKTYKKAKESIEKSLRKLDVDYIDLMLIHCPTPWKVYSLEGGYRYEKENLEVWRALEEAYKEGKLRAIGVSNFNISDLKNIINNAEIPPMVNQIPVHLGNVDHALIDFCRAINIAVEAYSPLAHGRLLKDINFLTSVFSSVSTTDLKATQIMLSYASSFSDVIIPKASSMPHILDNMKYHISLDKKDIATLERLYKKFSK